MSGHWLSGSEYRTRFYLQGTSIQAYSMDRQAISGMAGEVRRDKRHQLPLSTLRCRHSGRMHSQGGQSGIQLSPMVACRKQCRGIYPRSGTMGQDGRTLRNDRGSCVLISTEILQQSRPRNSTGRTGSIREKGDCTFPRGRQSNHVGHLERARPEFHRDHFYHGMDSQDGTMDARGGMLTANHLIHHLGF